MGAPDQPPVQCMHCGSPYVTAQSGCLGCGAYPALPRGGEVIDDLVPDPDLIGGEFQGPL